MKKVYFFTFLSVLVYIMVLTMSFASVSCDNGPTNDNGNGNSSGRATLNLSGQVRKPLNMKRQDRTSDTYQNYNPGRSLTVNSNLGVNGTISATGQLSFTISTPDDQYLATQEEFIQYMGYAFPVYGNITVTPSDMLVTFLELSFDGPDSDSGDEKNFSLYRERYSGTVNNGYGSGVDENVYYIYVNKDATVTMQGNSSNEFAYNNANLTLKQGWNAIRSTETWDFTDYEETGVIDLSIGDPVTFVWVAN